MTCGSGAHVDKDTRQQILGIAGIAVGGRSIRVDNDEATLETKVTEEKKISLPQFSRRIP